jgi:hypothetical protein
VSGRYLTLWCWAWGHQEPVHACTTKGIGWRCPDCQRFKVSPVLEALR